MFKKFHDNMIVIFGKNYGSFTIIILNGILFGILSMGYKNNIVMIMQLVLSFICITCGIYGLINSYKRNKKS